MTCERQIGPATPADIPGILALQEANLPGNGGSLSVRQPQAWFAEAVADNSIVIARRHGQVTGYVLGTSLAAQSHIPIIKAMCSAFPPPPDSYVYGPVCVAEAERGKGLAVALFEVLRVQMNHRSAVTFVRTDNAPSLRTHTKMGMRQLGNFLCNDVPYVAFLYEGQA